MNRVAFGKALHALRRNIRALNENCREMVLGQYFAFPTTGGCFRPIFITEDATTLDDGAANRGEVRAACSRSMAWDLGFQDADHGPSGCRPWTFMV
jgi:hypothetical protein